MVALLQPSLFDAAADAGPALGDLGHGVERTTLGRGAWVDVRRGWVDGAAELFDVLLDAVAWQAERRPMYDRVVDVPRLTRFHRPEDPLPHPLLGEARDALSRRYEGEEGGPLASVGCCLYRDGRDSVAWHGDRAGRASRSDTVVAIVSLGATRRLLLRPRGGGPSLAFTLASGDLLVMGGSCQRTWEHAVPKTARPVGPRISLQVRQRGVR